MAENEKNVKSNEDVKEDAGAKKPDIEAEVHEDENGNMKAVPKETFGQKAKKFGKKVWDVAKIAVPAFAAGVATTVGVATYIGDKDEKKQMEAEKARESLEEKKPEETQNQ